MEVKKKSGLKFGVIFILALIVLLFVVIIQAQRPQEGGQDQVAAIKRVLTKNGGALSKYRWTESTEVSVKGEIKKREQKECRYGPEGKVQKTLIRNGDQIQFQSEDYVERVAALVHEYVPLDPRRIQGSADAGSVSVEPSPTEGTYTVTIRDYLKAGDAVVIGFDSESKIVRSCKIQTFVNNPQDDPVTMEVSFASLPDGTAYAQQTMLNFPGRNIQVKVTNSGYARS